MLTKELKKMLDIPLINPVNLAQEVVQQKALHRLDAITVQVEGR